jgi:hypothetical protein
MLVLAAATLAVLIALATPAAARSAVAVGTFDGGSGSFLTTPDGTDGLRQLDGTLTFRQSGTGPITVNGSLSGLAPSTPYVAVPYKDGVCLPTPGITAFPYGSFFTNANGQVQVRNVTVNPAAINPVGTFSVSETRSVSVRQAVITSIALPGIPIGTPTVPNAAPPEGCDKNPEVN